MRVGAMKEEKKIRKKIKIEDLLPRDPVRVDLDAILDYVQGKAVLVTGGGGSIGSEICRQLAGHGVGHLIIFDIYENKYDNDKILKMIDDYAASKSRSVKANICEEIFSSLPYTSLEKNSEDYFAELSAARAGFNKNAGINYATKYATNRNTSCLLYTSPSPRDTR